MKMNEPCKQENRVEEKRRGGGAATDSIPPMASMSLSGPLIFITLRQLSPISPWCAKSITRHITTTSHAPAAYATRRVTSPAMA